MSAGLIARLRTLIIKRSATNSFERLTRQLTVVDGGVGRCVCELTVQPEHANNAGTLHGGFIATLVDSVSTTALLSVDDTQPGVSVNLDISYLGVARIGEQILIDAQTLKRGRTLAFLDVNIRKKSDNSIIALGRHTKFIGQTRSPAKRS